MKKALFFTALAAIALLTAGCSTPIETPSPVVATSASVAHPEVPAATLLGDMQNLSTNIISAGGLAAVGIAQSQSLDLALNMAKKNGRIELAGKVSARIEVLAKAFSEETGIPYESLLLSGFNASGKALAGQIAGSIAQTLKYETTGDTTTAYALMVLDPKEIAAQLAKETDLYARLQPTKAFATLTEEVKTYAAFKAAQK
jgi:hypothetical protein